MNLSPRLHCGVVAKSLGAISIMWLTSCASIEPAGEAGDPTTYSYTDPVKSGLKPRHPYPGPDDVCVSLSSNSLSKQFEVEGHFLIACPKHEVGAIRDRKVKQKAQVIGNAKHWVVMRVPVESKTSI